MDEKQELRNEIGSLLENLSVEELNHVQHVLTSLTESRQGGLYYLARFLGIRWDGVKAEMPLGLQHANTYGVAQGGTVYTLSGFAMGYAVLSKLESGQTVHTIEMKMNYIAPGKGERLIAYPEILHLGRTTSVVTCKVLNESELLIAIGQGTFFIK